MIVDCKAEYFGDQDGVRALAILADEDEEENIYSLHTAIKEASLELLYLGNPIASASLQKEHYIEKQEDEVVGDFRVYFFHFPLQSEMEVKFSVELLDGRTATAIRPVGKERAPDDHSVHWENPELAGKPKLNWPYTKNLDYDRNP